MSWREWMAARQLLAEESAGRLTRIAGHEEDDEWNKATKGLGRA
jgi:hypothetical protein